MSQNKNTYWISLSSDLLSSLASFQCSLFLTGIFPVTWAYPNVNQHFSSKSRLECPSVCPVSFRFQHPTPLSAFQKDHARKPTSAAPKKPSTPKKYDGPVYVSAEVYKLLSPEVVIALKLYNSEALNKMAKKRGIHVTDVTGQGLSIAETNISEEQADSHQDVDAPEGEADPILDYINSQHRQEDDMNHALQAYNIMTSPFSDTTPQRSINSVHTHLFYHVAQAKQAQHGSLVDRGANGGLAGFDVRILSKSSRKCAVTGIDQHQINGLDIVQCAALVKTNHGYVNLIMNEYAYYGKGHTIHSSGQIEWNKNQVDDRSFKVGGSQCITTLDGYSFPLKCTGDSCI